MRGSRFVRHTLAPLMACLICAPVCLAQVDDWEHVRIIQPGRNVFVRLQSHKALIGKMDAWRADGMSLQRGGRVVSLDKSEIAQVDLLIGKSRARKAAWAGIITGVGVGALTGLAYLSSDWCEASGATVAVGSGALGGGVAAGIAALFPQRHEVLYARPAAPPGDVKGAPPNRRWALSRWRISDDIQANDTAVACLFCSGADGTDQ